MLDAPPPAPSTPAAPALGERLGVVGVGAIGGGLAALASAHGPVTVLCRSPEAERRARPALQAACARVPRADTARVTVVSDPAALAEATFVVEAIVEAHAPKAALLATLDAHLEPGAVLATTTSSLGVAELAAASGRPERFCALHVFNPVARMALVELAFAEEASPDTRERARALAEGLGKQVVEVPDSPGFVVNRLLFPFLFDAVRLLERTGLAPAEVDRCLTLGAGHPLGPLALLDLVGLDVAAAIGEAIEAPVPDRVRALVADGALGRKAGRGFHAYAPRRAAH